MANYIFGEIDVAKLDEDGSPIPPFDLSRSMQLNPSNELVQAIYAFVGAKVDEVRRQLVEEEKKRKASEDARRLEEQARQIARVINEDFDDFRQRLAKAKAHASGGSDQHTSAVGGTGREDDLLFGSELPAVIVAEAGNPGSSGGTRLRGTEPRDLSPQVAPTPGADSRGRQAGGNQGRHKGSGGFQVKFDNMGQESHRAKYLSEQRTIFINLDHPQLGAARAGRPVEDPAFRRLAYEVAFSEYAVALASELAARDEYLDPSDPIVDIRDTLNRVARRGASLYEE
jgi:hypothetical protein